MNATKPLVRRKSFIFLMCCALAAIVLSVIPDKSERIDSAAVLKTKPAQLTQAIEVSNSEITEDDLSNQTSHNISTLTDFENLQAVVEKCNAEDLADNEQLMVNYNDMLLTKLNPSIAEEQLAQIMFPYQAEGLTEHAIEENKNKLLQQLLSFHQLHPTNKLAYYLLLNECNTNLPDFCTNEFLNKVVQIDKNNGFLWLTIASIAIKKQDIELTNNALYQASSANEFNSYHFEVIELHQDIVQKYLPEQSKFLLISGIGYASALAWGYESALNYCVEEGTENKFLDETCLQIGQQMAATGKTSIQQLMGLGIQIHIHSKLANTDKVIALEDEADNSQNSDPTISYFSSILLLLDENLASEWLKQGLAFGEKKATDYLANEINWLAQDPNYNPCPSNAIH